MDGLQEQQLLEQACECLEGATGLHPQIERASSLYLRVAPERTQRCFEVHTVPRLTPASVSWIAARLEPEYPVLIVSEYVNPRLAERLKSMDIGYLDLAGNAYINAPPVYVYVRGNKPVAAESVDRDPAGRAAFQSAGLRVVFALLCAPRLLHATYREIADAAGVSLGSASRSLQALRDQGFLLETGSRTRRLHNHHALIQRWTLAYPEQLRPRTLLGRYRAPGPGWWEDADLEPYGAVWGGEVAAARLTGYLIPERVSIHTRMTPNRLMAAFGLRKDPDGDIELHQTFWPPECHTEGPELAPRLLVHAELMASGDERNIETARMLYEHGLAGRLEPD